MDQLLPDQFSLLEPLFTSTAPNDPLLRAFLRQRVPGQALVDAVTRPRAAAVAVNYRFVFFGGQPSRAFQEQAIGHFRRQQSLDVVWPAKPLRLPQRPAPDACHERLEFRRRRDRQPGHLDTLAAAAPQAEVCRIDSRTIHRCLWREDVLRATGSTSEFLAHGLGFCLRVGQAIVAEAYAVIWDEPRAEIATVTHPDHRGRGFATVLCAALIKACEDVGLDTYWNCDADNAPSVRLAHRLGYDDLHLYRLLRYSHVQPAPPLRRKHRSVRSIRGFARRLFARSGAA